MPWPARWHISAIFPPGPRMVGPVATKLVNTAWLTLEQVVRLAIAFFVMALVARHLGPERFGAYAYLFSLAALFAPLSAFGLDAIVMRRSVAAPEARDTTLGTALAIRIGGAVVGLSAAIGTVVVFGGPRMATWELMAIATLTLLFLPAETFNAWFKAQERMAIVALPRIAVVLLIAIAALWLVWRDAGLSAFVALRAGEAALFGFVAVGVYAVATAGLGQLRLRPAEFRSLLREGSPLFLSALAVMLYTRIDQVMLGHMASEVELGLYGVAVRVSDAALLLPMALRASFYASLVRAHRLASDSFDAHMQRVFDVMALASLAAMSAVAVAAALLLVPAFGIAYVEAMPMIFVLLISIPFHYLGGAREAMLTVRSWLWTAPVTSAIGVAANILLNLILIPRYGGIGAASATVLSYWLAVHGTCFLFPWLRPAGMSMIHALNPVAAGLRLWRLSRGQENA